MGFSSYLEHLIWVSKPSGKGLRIVLVKVKDRIPTILGIYEFCFHGGREKMENTCRKICWA